MGWQKQDIKKKPHFIEMWFFLFFRSENLMVAYFTIASLSLTTLAVISSN